MIANTDNISSILGVANIPDDAPMTIGKTTYINNTADADKAESDYEFTRRNLYDIIEKGQYALDEMMEFARQSQHPRAFEVVGGMINGLVDANQKLLNLSKQIKEIKGKKEEKNITNNNLFVGSTAELQKMLKGE
jgi:hypothetical protein